MKVEKKRAKVKTMSRLDWLDESLGATRHDSETLCKRYSNDFNIDDEPTASLKRGESIE